MSGINFKMDERIKNYSMITKQELLKKFNKTISSNLNLSNYSWFNLRWAG